jgi:Flagellar P-ring protein
MTNIRNGLWLLAAIFLAGCSTPWTSKEPESELEKRSQAVKEVMQSKDRPLIVGDAAEVLWTETREYEGFGIVNALLDTGGDVKPSGQRDYILKEMRSDGVDNPNSVLKLPSTALARLAVIVGPEHTKGDNLDVIVEISDECDASSLVNGWLMPSHIREMALLGGSVKQSELKARAQGPLVILPRSMCDGSSDLKAGVVLGGANLLEGRQFAIRIKESVRHVTTSAGMSRAINDRYWFYKGSDRRGVATAKNDQMIMLDVPERYRWDVAHFADAVMSTGFSESSDQRAARIEKCRKRIKEPTATRLACLQLESIGEETIPVLEEGLKSDLDEVKYHSAYSLAYLNHPPAVPVLVELARSNPRFRAGCLIGLQLNSHYSAKEALIDFLQSEEPDLRNGALWALRRRDRKDSIAQGYPVGKLVHVVNVPSQIPLVAVSLEERPEIAMFGGNCNITMDEFYEVNPRFTIRKQPDGRLKLVRFQPKDEDLSAIASPDLLSLIEAFEKIGASYNDLVWWLDEASQRGWLSSPIAMNARPKGSPPAFEVMLSRRNDRSKSSKKASAEDINGPDEEISDSKKSWWSWKS